ncbi:hypothetical protein MW332_004971 [Vibrio parahaemolyticus]|nr:hypothetical protein [Vibrio parahaemolyticus]
MSKGKSQFVGASGQFYVAHQLTKHFIHASITVGNAPSVDIIAAKEDGTKSISIQVKTSRDAYRRNRYGSEGCEWDVGAGVIGKSSPNLWYAFVDLKLGSGGEPDVYIVPSLWVADFVKPEWSRKMYFLPSSAWDLTQNKWGLISSCLDGCSDTEKFSCTWLEDKLVRWGQNA